MSAMDTDGLFPLFVYGTLRTGQPLEPWLTGVTEEVTPAFIAGCLYPCYSGKYPVAKLNERGLIHGEVRYCRLDVPLYDCIAMERQAGYEMWEVNLFDFEGRCLEEKVFAFHYPHRVPTNRLIQSGDWVEWVEKVQIRW